MTRTGAHVIVVGNEKGGSGKSTTAFHLAIYLLYQGFRVASIDVDSRQQTFTQYVRNRRDWARQHELKLPHTTHFHLPQVRNDSAREGRQIEFDLFREALSEVEHSADYLIIDTPGFDTNLSRLSHSLADTLVTPVNDSLIDLNVLAQINPHTGDVVEVSHYARLVQRARSERMSIDGQTFDWIIVRNRIAMLSSRSMRQVQDAIETIGIRVGSRVADGIAERVVFRSLFPMGLTVFDPLDAAELGSLPSTSQMSARQEYKALVLSLKLPVNQQRAEARRIAMAALAQQEDRRNPFPHMRMRENASN